MKLDPKEMISESEADLPHTIKEVIIFLKTQQIYDLLLKLLANAKGKDKI